MCDEQTIREPFDNVQYKVFLLPQFKDGQGVMILKSHHSFTDGLGFATLL